MSSPRQPVKKQNNSEIIVEEGALFSGPLPPPGVLKGYGDVDSQYPERIFKWAARNPTVSLWRRPNVSYSRNVMCNIAKFVKYE
jgi:hypothetical protein